MIDAESATGGAGRLIGGSGLAVKRTRAAKARGPGAPASERSSRGYIAAKAL